MARIAPGGKGIGRISWDDVNFGHGEADALGEPLDHVVCARQLFTRDRLRPVHGQRDLVGKEIGDEVHHASKDQGIDHAAASTNEVAHK